MANAAENSSGTGTTNRYAMTPVPTVASAIGWDKSWGMQAAATDTLLRPEACAMLLVDFRLFADLSTPVLRRLAS